MLGTTLITAPGTLHGCFPVVGDDWASAPRSVVTHYDNYIHAQVAMTCTCLHYVLSGGPFLACAA